MKRALLLLVAVSLPLSVALPSWAQKSMPVVGPPLDTVGPEHDPACTVPYSDPNGLGIALFQPDGELFDDLHMEAGFVGPMSLCAFDVRVRSTLADPINAEVNIYENTPADGAPGAVLAGPFFVTIPPGPISVIHHEAASGVVETDVWFGMKFPSGNPYGWNNAGAPTVGTSHDVIWIKDAVLDQPGNLGDGFSNFYITLYTAPIPVQSQISTWGSVKAIYR